MPLAVSTSPDSTVLIVNDGTCTACKLICNLIKVKIMDENKLEAYIGGCYDELKAIRQNLDEMNRHLCMIAMGVMDSKVSCIGYKWNPETKTYQKTKKGY